MVTEIPKHCCGNQITQNTDVITKLPKHCCGHRVTKTLLWSPNYQKYWCNHQVTQTLLWSPSYPNSAVVTKLLKHWWSYPNTVVVTKLPKTLTWSLSYPKHSCSHQVTKTLMWLLSYQITNAVGLPAAADVISEWPCCFRSSSKHRKFTHSRVRLLRMQLYPRRLQGYMHVQRPLASCLPSSGDWYF